MRDRHLPRLCRSCDRPMARRGDTCWQCGAEWASNAAIAASTGAAYEADADADRWLDEGGSFAFEASAPPRPAVLTI